MATQCNDIETLLPTYLDGELAPHDQLSFDHHMADCAVCRELVRSEGAYLVRVRELLVPPPMPEDLAARVRVVLDQADGGARAARRRSWRSWALPGAASMAAAAALVLMVVNETDRSPSANDNDSAGVQIASHIPAPSGSIPISLTPFGQRDRDSSRPSWIPRQSRWDVYPGDGRVYLVSLDMLNCGNIDVSRLEAVMASGAELRVARGKVNTVIYQAGNTCMVFASDMGLKLLIQEIVRSGLVSR
jgi:anti-sigma factor RsiW